MSKESIQGPLSALRNAGTVCGVCLARETEVLVNLFPYSEERINDVVAAVEEVGRFFAEKGRSVDQMSLGFDGGCLCVVEDGEFRLIVMHLSPEEVDFIAKAARAFLADFQLGFFTEQFSAIGARPADASPEEESEAVLEEAPEEEAPTDGEFDISAIYSGPESSEKEPDPSPAEPDAMSDAVEEEGEESDTAGGDEEDARSEEDEENGEEPRDQAGSLP